MVGIRVIPIEILVAGESVIPVGITFFWLE
jgi:hypothetical protein